MLRFGVLGLGIWFRRFQALGFRVLGSGSWPMDLEF